VDGFKYTCDIDFSDSIYTIKAGPLTLRSDDGMSLLVSSTDPSVYPCKLELYDTIGLVYHTLDKNYLPNDTIYEEQLNAKLANRPNIYHGDSEPNPNDYEIGDIYIVLDTTN
jgi:hypothetical protein